MGVTVYDFHIHYTPEPLVRARLGGRETVTRYVHGVPASTSHEGLFRLDDHIAAMDAAGVDVALLSSAAAMDAADTDAARVINDTLQRDIEPYGGRFIGLAHTAAASPTGVDELRRCAGEFGSPGAVLSSTTAAKYLDDPVFDPFYTTLEELGMFLLVHPALEPPVYAPEVYGDYDLYRAVGREHELLAGTVRMVWGGVFDRHPGLKVVVSHLAGGLAVILDRIRGYSEREHMGVAQDPRHSRVSDYSFEHYFGRNLFFDTGGLYGSVTAIKAALLEFPAGAIVLGSDYPQEVRTVDEYRNLVQGIRESDITAGVIAQILELNAGKVIASSEPRAHDAGGNR